MPTKSKRTKPSSSACTCGLSGDYGNNSNHDKVSTRKRLRAPFRSRRPPLRTRLSSHGRQKRAPIQHRPPMAALKKRVTVRARQASSGVVVKHRRRQGKMKPTDMAARPSPEIVKTGVKGKDAVEDSHRFGMQPQKNPPPVDAVPEPSTCTNENNAVMDE